MAVDDTRTSMTPFIPTASEVTQTTNLAMSCTVRVIWTSGTWNIYNWSTNDKKEEPKLAKSFHPCFIAVGLIMGAWAAEKILCTQGSDYKSFTRSLFVTRRVIWISTLYSELKFRELYVREIGPAKIASIINKERHPVLFGNCLIGTVNTPTGDTRSCYNY